MDFFERQEKARRSTTLLILYFVAGMAMLIVALYLATLLAFGFLHHHRNYDTQSNISLWNPQLFVGVTLGTLAIVTIGSAYKTMELSNGGSSVAEMMDGELINANTTQPDERKLLNVIEEMSLASGVPVPHVYVMRNEPGINAFAAGHSTSDAVICVTAGCMKMLTRDELQGVIGHEYSHILNGDMRLNLRLMGIIFGIVCLAVIGRILLQTRDDRKNALPILGLAMLAIGWVGVFFGQLIQAAVSRQREFLADASSVQFTRNPAGLAGALKKIGGLSYGSRLQATHANEASHMFFGNGIGSSLFGLMDTHPPLEERIRAIDPSFDGKFTAPVADASEEISSPPRQAPRPPPFPMPGFPQTGAGLMAGLATASNASKPAFPHVAAVTPAHIEYAVGLRNSFPQAVQTAAREPFGASALVYALLLGSEPDLRARQLALLDKETSQGIRQETEGLLADVASIATSAKLPIIDLALPALRHLSPAQYQEFVKAMQGLIESDGKLDLFEYVLQKIVLRHLDTQFNGARQPVVQYYALAGLGPQCAVLLSALAYAGQDQPDKILMAFQQGAQQLSYIAQMAITLLPPDACDLSRVDAALDRFSAAAPQIKKNILNACAQTVVADGVVLEAEAELLRAIAETLDCPMPPFII